NAGDYTVSLSNLTKALERVPASRPAFVFQRDARAPLAEGGITICTDPPYYDNIGYADLSDFFYVWLRQCTPGFPDLFSTLLVPKTAELVATPYRFDGDKQRARDFFETGFEKAFAGLRSIQSTNYPLTFFYAFKQTESGEEKGDDQDETFSTGWETMLEGLLRSRFEITGTRPMRSELANRPIAS